MAMVNAEVIMDAQGADAVFVESARDTIEQRAKYAGMDFDRDDIVTAHDDGTATTFLRRTRNAIYDEDGEFLEWEYKHLVWAEYMEPRRSVIDGRAYVKQFIPRIVMICPWLVIMKLPDGTVRDGAKVGLSW